jgi:hypothetical protein
MIGRAPHSIGKDVRQRAPAVVGEPKLKDLVHRASTRHGYRRLVRGNPKALLDQSQHVTELREVCLSLESRIHRKVNWKITGSGVRS